jgi:hypothetical protein
MMQAEAPLQPWFNKTWEPGNFTLIKKLADEASCDTH